MPPVGFEPTISAGERPKTYDLDRAATGIGQLVLVHVVYTVCARNLFKKIHITGAGTASWSVITQLQAKTRCHARIQAGSGAYLASYLMDTTPVGTIPGVK